MSKFITFLVVMSGLMILFHLAGIIETGSTPHSSLLTLLLGPENIKNLPIYTQIIVAIEAVGLGTAIILGLISRNAELIAAGAFSIYMFNLGWDFLAVYGVIANANKPLALLIFSPFLLAYVVTIFLFWRGRD